MDTQVYFASMIKQVCCHQKEHGMDTLGYSWKLFCWGITACLYNRHPVLDWNNVEWGPGFESYREVQNTKLNDEDFFVGVVGLCPDLDEACNEFKLAHFNSNSPCYKCPCNCDTLPWTDLSSTSPCLQQTYTWANAAPYVSLPNDHPVWSIPGMTVFGVLWDILHGLDLGPTSCVKW